MSRYGIDPLDLSGLKTVSIHERGGKVRVAQFARPFPGGGIESLFESLPRILAGETMRDVVEALVRARAAGKPILWGLGGHVIKCGLAPVLLDLMRRGFATGFALNGAAAIHDFEIAIAGCTSEDVETVLPDGRFGSAEETGREMNDAITEGAVNERVGIGEALGERLSEIAKPEFAQMSLLYGAYQAGTPVTVHVAIGTDTPHAHPAADGAAIGAASHLDFRLLCRVVSQLDDGGAYINAGSAVVLPEVFLKALSAARNLGNRVTDFTTVNLDFLQHYRPTVNVVQRPHAQSEGRGYALTGHHEIMIPLLAAVLIEVGG